MGKVGDIYPSSSSLYSQQDGTRFLVERLSAKTAFAMHDLAGLSAQIMDIQSSALAAAADLVKKRKRWGGEGR